jgi:Holliday junction resolvase RusA-like endonuclease
MALSGELCPVKRPDLDNYMKTALDACNEIVFADDSQIVKLIANKRYGEKPRL